MVGYHFAAILPILENKYFSYILYYPVCHSIRNEWLSKSLLDVV